MRDYSNTELNNGIDEWIVGTNAQRNRAILKSRLIDGLTFDALAELYEMSPRQIKRIVYKTQEVLFRHL